MSFTLRRGVSAACCIVLAASVASAGELSRYREFELGSSLAAVLAVTKTADRDLKTVHSRPALLQEVAWQPRYMTGPPVADRSAINEVVFSFLDDRLFKIAVAYDRSRTSGLTNEDMTAALTEVYGARSVTPRPAADPLENVLAEWREGETHVELRRNRYNNLFSLVITSMPLEASARKAQATAAALDVREAPAREAAQLKKRADDQRQAEEQARTANKKVFTP